MQQIVRQGMIDFLAELAYDPVAFVYGAFPWGEGKLEGRSPQEWQLALLADIRDGLKSPGKVIREAVASGHGIGKAQAPDARIETPQGNRRFGDLRPGDWAFGKSGKPVRVLQCKWYRDIPFYRVHFDDATCLDVSSGHLWQAKCRNDRRRGRAYRTISTQEILAAGVRRKNGKNAARQWEIPMQKAAEFPTQEIHVAPYWMGVWLGDGSRARAGYTKPDREIRERLKEQGYVLREAQDGNAVYLPGIQPKMKQYAVFTCRSHERYIPEEYKYNTVQVRQEVLSGLLDTDGEINRQGSIQYATTSGRLAEDMLWLVRSLGGKAKMQPTKKKGWYRKDGKRIACRDCWRITMTLPFNPFSVRRKKERYKKDIEHRYRVRWIDRIEPLGLQDGMCITVEEKDGLYLAEDFIVTHNSALVAWIILWAISTHEDTRGIITANTDTQLKSKTWAELSKWYECFLAKEMFTYTATALFANEPGHEKTWRIDAIPWNESHSESFAGLHNQGNRILLVFDEASAIANVIWEVAEGAMTDADTEIIWCAFGNPTRTSGRFYDCFHRDRALWRTRQIDSRDVAISNKELIAEWAETRGEDSDFFKVRVKGEFPSASELQFISAAIIEQATKRVIAPHEFDFAPVILGVDPAWTGEDTLEIFLRQGSMCKALLTCEKNDDDVHMAERIAYLEDKYRAVAVNIDQGYGTGIYSVGRNMGRTWNLVSFAAKPRNPYYANKRAEMWAEMKEWLKTVGALPDDPALRDDLKGPEAFMNRSGKLQLESKEDMKKRGLASPNKADALALTFAYPVRASPRGARASMCNTDYDPF